MNPGWVGAAAGHDHEKGRAACEGSPARLPGSDPVGREAWAQVTTWLEPSSRLRADRSTGEGRTNALNRHAGNPG